MTEHESPLRSIQSPAAAQGQGEAILKPAASIILLTLALFWLGLFTAERLCWHDLVQNTATTHCLLLATAVGILAFICLLLKGRQSLLLVSGLVVLSAVAGLWIGVLFWFDVESDKDRLVTAGLGIVEVKVTSDYRQGMYSKSSEATIWNQDSEEARVRIIWAEDEDPLPMGTCISGEISFIPLDDDSEWLYQRGISGSISLEQHDGGNFAPGPIGAIESFRERNVHLIKEVGGVGSDILRGVLLGDTTALQGSESDRSFKVTGLSHLIAVSGSHLMVIAALLCWLTSHLQVQHRFEFVLIAAFLIGYVILTGLQPSAIRACVMTLIGSTSWFMGRRRHAPSALAFAALVMLAIQPTNAFSLGFGLSVFAVIGLTMFTPLVQGWVIALVGIGTGKRSLWRRMDKLIVEPLSLTLTAQAVTVPLTLPTFATLSIIAPFANILVTPLISVLIAGGMLTICLAPLWPDGASLLLQSICQIGSLTVSLVDWLADIPYAAVPMTVDPVVAMAACLLVLLLIRRFWPQPQTVIARGILVLMVALTFSFSVATTLVQDPKLVMMDVGQGDALLVRDGQRAVLIDTGEYDSDLIRALARQRITHLDAVVITHLDSDHCGALDSLRGVVQVEQIYFAKGLLQSKGDNKVIQTASLVCNSKMPAELGRGDCIRLSDSLSMTMVWPFKSITEGSNADSICLRLDFDADLDGTVDSNMLLTGDAESEQIEELLDIGAIAQAQLLKIGHHGSSDAIQASQLERLGTQIALISVGADNRFGHPTKDTLGVLAASEVMIYRTDINGDVTVQMKADGLRVLCDTIILDPD